MTPLVLCQQRSASGNSTVGNCCGLGQLILLGQLMSLGPTKSAADVNVLLS
jgi:hypothetical protein